MGFHEVRFPDDISWGSAGGPSYSTEIVETNGGAETRISRWNEARRQYNVAYGVKTYTQLAAMQNFYIGRRGAAFGFRFKDFTDCTTSLTTLGLAPPDNNGQGLGGDAPLPTDEIIGTGDNSQKYFQLVKRYTSGAVTRVRTITKPVAGTVRIAFDESEQLSGWTVNTTTGLVTFTTPVSAGVTITAGCEFDVPVRFTKDSDSLLSLTLEDFGSGSVPSISLIEVVEERFTFDEYFYGGASVFTADESIAVSHLDGRVIVFSPTSSGRTLALPDPQGLPDGAEQFFLVNDGSASFDVKTFDEASTVVTIPSGGRAIILLAGTTWYSLT